MLATKFEDAKREEGFTLIELLVVVIIIGILAAIPIPVFLDQRSKARESALDATLRSGATYMEIYATEGDSYPTSEAQLEAIGFRSGDNVNFSAPALSLNGSNWCLQANHAQDTAQIRSLTASVGAPVDDGCGTVENLP